MDIQWPDLIDLTYDMFFIIDKKGWIKFANKPASDYLFYTKDQFLKMNLNEILFESDKFIEILDTIISSADKEKMDKNLKDAEIDLSLIKENIGYQDLILISNDTNLKIMMANFQARRIIIDDIEYFLLIFRDITERKYLEQELFKITENLEILVQQKTLELQKKNEMLEKLATRDTLTNLMNIRRFREVLTEEIDGLSVRRKKGNKRKIKDIDSLSVIMIDADHFKYYNDTFGHLVGDEVIKGIGRILTDSVRTNDFVARYGGDEFIVLLPKSDKQQTIRTCERIRDNVQKNLRIKQLVKTILNMDDVVIPKEHEITLSMGISVYKDGKNMDELINEADSALYKSKESGRNCTHIFESDSTFCVSSSPPLV